VNDYPYRVVVRKVNDNYSAYSPDVPGCIATGPTYEQTERNIRDAIEFHIEGLIAEGLPVPEPYRQPEAQSANGRVAAK
jgi:predicted RNase H-like HicB family nuclease